MRRAGAWVATGGIVVSQFVFSLPVPTYASPAALVGASVWNGWSGGERLSAICWDRTRLRVDDRSETERR